MRLLRWFLILVLALAAGRGLQAFDPEKDVSVTYVSGSVRLSPPPGSHLKQAFLEIALRPGTPGKIRMGKIPAGKDKDELGDPIWRGPVSVPIHGENLKGEVEVLVTYQPCTEGEGGVCYPPTVHCLRIKASDIPPARREVQHAGGTLQAPARPLQSPLPAPVVQTQLPSRTWGFLWGLVLAFGFGLLASLTPCVYPMIPITMAVVGAKGGGKAKGFALSLVLVLGMAVTYTILGVFAARTGAAFGAAAQRPAFLIPVSILFALFALSLFGAFEIRLPQALQARLQGGPRRGWLGAFLTGLVLGPIAAPCVSPYLGTLLIAIAQHGHVWLGALELFVFALGMGVLFVVAGTFAATLPRSGDWLVHLKEIMGLVILGFAVWNLRLVLPAWTSQTLWCATLLVGASILGAYRPVGGILSGFQKGLGLLALALAILLGIRALEGAVGLKLLPRGNVATVASPSSIWLEQDLEGALARAKSEHKLVLVDVYADWCAECKQLDEKTWPDPGVRAWIQAQAIPVRVDTDRVRKDLLPRLGIKGYPTVLVLDSEGREVRRSMGFLSPATMQSFLTEAMKK